MTRLKREQLHNLILEIIINTDLENLVWCENGCVAYLECVGIPARKFQKILAQKLKYYIRVEEIKHTLKNIKHTNGYYYFKIRS